MKKDRMGQGERAVKDRLDTRAASRTTSVILDASQAPPSVALARAATHTKDSYLSAQYHRLVLRRGGKKATVAVGHTLLVIISHVLAEEKDYEERGGNYFDEWDRQAVQKRLVRRLERLGYEVTLTPTRPVG